MNHDRKHKRKKKQQKILQIRYFTLSSLNGTRIDLKLKCWKENMEQNSKIKTNFSFFAWKNVAKVKKCFEFQLTFQSVVTRKKNEFILRRYVCVFFLHDFHLWQLWCFISIFAIFLLGFVIISAYWVVFMLFNYKFETSYISI